MYRFIKLHCALAITALVFAQCTKDFTNDISVGESQDASATKIINTSHSAVAGSLIVKFNEAGVQAFENGTRSAGVTRSNIEPLNRLLLDIDATFIERIFPVDIKNEEATRKAGLHRWYIVRFDNKQSLDKVARSLAKIDEVERVEFNSYMETPKLKFSACSETNSAATRLSTPQFNDPLAYAQWSLHNTGDKSLSSHAVAGMDINAHEAWKYTTGDKSIIVAIIDEGVDYTHEDLAGNMWVNEDEIPNNGIDDDKNGYIDDIHGVNFVELEDRNGKKYGPISWDNDSVVGERHGDTGHGTHTAGTIAAVNNNRIGVCGIAGGDGSGNGVRIMSAQIFSGPNSNNASVAVVATAMKYAADNGAVLANNSWGSAPSSNQNDSWYIKYESLQHETTTYFKQKKNHPNLNGGVMIFAAGNDYFGQASYPGAYRDNVCVTATGISGMPAVYTNYGPGCNIAAPGGDSSLGAAKCMIASTMPKKFVSNGYGYSEGTSMACPHVTGVAALGLAYAKKIGKTLTADEFTTKLLFSVNDINTDIKQQEDKYGKYLNKMGTGRIDAFRFLMNIEGITCISVPRGVNLHRIDMSKFISDGLVNPKILDITINDKDKKRLDISYLKILENNNKIVITANKTGSAIVEIKMVAGGEIEGNQDVPGGMTITKKFALIVRDGFAENGGWL